jgi:hypothetical protein
MALNESVIDDVLKSGFTNSFVDALVVEEVKDNTANFIKAFVRNLATKTNR